MKLSTLFSPSETRSLGWHPGNDNNFPHYLVLLKLSVVLSFLKDIIYFPHYLVLLKLLEHSSQAEASCNLSTLFSPSETPAWAFLSVSTALLSTLFSPSETISIIPNFGPNNLFPHYLVLLKLRSVCCQKRPRAAFHTI